jgi:hypothetical protein
VSRSYHHNKSGFRFSDDEISNAANEAYAEKKKRLGQRSNPVEENVDPQEAERIWQQKKIDLQNYWKNKR